MILSDLAAAILMAGLVSGEPVSPPVPEPAISNDEEFSEFAHSYYRAPRPELIESAMRYLDGSSLVQKSEIRPLFEMMFSCLLHRPELRSRSWKGVVDSLNEPTRSLLVRASTTEPETLLGRTPISPTRNDLNWACFFASGEPRYVENLIATLEHWPDRANLNLFMTSASAKWSLSSNARAHPAVAEILEAAASEEGEAGRQAREALSLPAGEVERRTIEVLDSQRDRGVW